MPDASNQGRECDYNLIKKNLEEIERRIQRAAERSGRHRSDVTLLCVTKTHPAEVLREAYDLGYREFGENKVQEMREKVPLLPGDIRWHLIGHLQKNKVKYVCGMVCMIHSVDSLELAEEISRRAQAIGQRMPILIEVNMAGEASKFGIRPDEAVNLVRAVAPLPGVQLRGLMTIPPRTDNPETNRPYFRGLRELAVDIDCQNIDNIQMNVLSMGMSEDYEVAIEEGATIVRVGTAIFGERHYNI